MYAVDLHTHTRFFHGRARVADLYDPVGFRLLAGWARLRRLDGIALTNHDYYRDLGGDGRPAAIPGIEISTSRGHVTVVGPDPPTEITPERLSPAEAVDLAHDHGCVAILAHPFRNSSARETDADFDAVEINGKTPQTWTHAQRVGERFDLPLVGGSDAHYPFEVGRAYTLVDVDTLTPETVVEAVRSGDVEVAVNFAPGHRLLRKGYRITHRLKGHDESEVAPGVGEPPES